MTRKTKKNENRHRMAKIKNQPNTTKKYIYIHIYGTTRTLCIAGRNAK